MFKTALVLSFLSLVLVSASPLEDGDEEGRHEQPKCDLLTKKWTLWDGGLAATVKIPVVKDISSWSVTVTFNKVFSQLSFFNALAVETEGSVFNLGNEAWSGSKKQGDEIAFSLLGDYISTSSEPIMLEEVRLNGEVMCSGMNTE